MPKKDDVQLLTEKINEMKSEEAEFKFPANFLSIISEQMSKMDEHYIPSPSEEKWINPFLTLFGKGKLLGNFSCFEFKTDQNSSETVKSYRRSVSMIEDQCPSFENS